MLELRLPWVGLWRKRPDCQPPPSIVLFALIRLGVVLHDLKFTTSASALSRPYKIGELRARAGRANIALSAMARIVIPIYFDYASTLCYVAWRIVRELEAELGFEALWKGVPIRLRDNRTRPGNALGTIARMKVMNVIAETGVEVVPPENWIDSGAALMGSELAREANAFAPYHERVFRAAFEDRHDIAEIGLLSEIALAVGYGSRAVRGGYPQRPDGGSGRRQRWRIGSPPTRTKPTVSRRSVIQRSSWAIFR
jgi:2-hydroxychromene-2-carboxylate isomerase